MAEEEKRKEPDPAEEEDEEEEEGLSGAPAWVTTFADLVTLLMVFFILLFAMGSIEDEKWRLVKESLKSALGSESIPEEGTRQGLDVISAILREESVDAAFPQQVPSTAD